MSKDKPPLPMVTLGFNGLSPLTAGDAEALSMLPQGSVFELKRVSQRHPRHLRTYWKALGLVVKSGANWPTAEHLHRELKLACGYIEKVIDWNTGEVHEIPDSIAFDKMAQDDFNVYFKTAMAKLAERVGYDPLRFLEGVE